MPELTYQQLQAEVTALAKDIARSTEAIKKEAEGLQDEAQDTARLADSIASLKVDRATVGETTELSKIMAGLRDAAIAYASASDTTALQAQAVHAQNRTSHSGINEAVQRSPVGRDIYQVDRRWVTPE